MKALLILLSATLSLSCVAADLRSQDAHKRFVESKDYDSGVTTFEQELAAHPNDVDILIQLGLLHYSFEKYPEARATLERAIEIDPNHIDARNTWGMMRSNSERAAAFRWPQDTISGRFTWPVLYNSPDDMLLTRFKPSYKPASALARLFAVEDYVKVHSGFEPAEDLVFPDEIDSSTVIWKSDEKAILFARATPPTQASPSVVGVLFLAIKVPLRDGDVWIVGNAKSITARGTNSDIRCELTSKKTNLSDTIDPVITIQRTTGDMDDFYQTSKSYTLHNRNFIEIE